jgi:RNA polymerase sigma-70 factor (ECF subfamily)
MPQDPEIRKKSNEEDNSIVRSILSGNKNEFSRIQKKYKKVVNSVIRRMIRNENDIEDLVQETFIKAYNALDSYNFQFNFSSWLLRIASNSCIDHLRKKKLDTISISRGGDTIDEDEPYFDIPDKDLLPDAVLVSTEMKQILQASIDKLPENFRKIIILRFLMELDYTEISKELGIPLGTVKATLFRSRQMLQVILKKNRILFTE